MSPYAKVREIAGALIVSNACAADSTAANTAKTGAVVGWCSFNPG